MLGCCRKKKEPLEEVVVYLNNETANSTFEYPTNKINSMKYSPWFTFPFKNLFEQFRRYHNSYFLLVAIFSCIPGVSPISWTSAVLPFVLIILTAAVKEAFEDYKRWRSDVEVNEVIYQKLNPDGSHSDVVNQDIKVGDILYVVENEEVPADLVLLCCSDKREGVCYVDTANLDGETNLKIFRAFDPTSKMKKDQIAQLKGVVRSEPANETLYRFIGNLQFDASPDAVDPRIVQDGESPAHPLDEKNLLMRGVTMRNTKFAYGLVVYAGKDSKLALNSVEPPSKFSQSEKRINIVTLIIFAVKMLVVCAFTITSAVIQMNDGDGHWYVPITGLDEFSSSPAYNGISVFLAYFILFGYFIPISLFVNLEIIKLTQAGYMMGDDDMKVIVDTRDGPQEKGMSVKNSNLNDELSKVKYIFSDKTGTLTANKMVFHECSINGTSYPDSGKGKLSSKVKKDDHIRDFFLHLALNHEVLPEENEDGEGMPKYAAPTPDEIALVRGAYINGVQFLSKHKSGLTIQVGKKKLVYKMLDAIEFTSTRKRSSVIVKAPNGDIILFSKGADEVMFPRIAKSVKKKIVTKVKDALTAYSVEGLRTLVLGYRIVDKKKYNAFHKAYTKAQSSIGKDRDEKLAKAAELIEKDLQLQGCTALLDKLQNKVPWAINYLIRAGIKVWMITGDKQETAENIGHSCRLLSKGSHLVRVVKSKSSEECRAQLVAARNEMAKFDKVSLVIDGKSLTYALVEHSAEFQDVGKGCETVICCRADPLQKALVVRMMKAATSEVCLSIGDGANDVSMIQEAHIGVGIWGEEGTQAARNSDYAIRRFRHLTKLLTVHGRYSMLRTALMVEYSFYKNIAMFMAQVWFAFYSQFSGQTFFDSWFMTLYNVLVLSLPPLALAFFEKDLTEEKIGHYPEVYRELTRGLYFTTFTIVRWFTSAFYQSIIFFFTIYFLPQAFWENGQVGSLWTLSTMVGTAGVWAIIVKGMTITRRFTWVHHAANFVSFVAPLVLFTIESNWLGFFPEYYYEMNQVLSAPVFWFYALCILAICIVPEISFDYLQRQYFPDDWMIVQEVKPHQIGVERKHDASLGRHDSNGGFDLNSTKRK
eukprot:TRINITY_DN2183_c0_g1_i3.p1 TRINITY_DN2183_c0_g1~~TRINITY_DN2183_c0_g1_i3.p1  ORF type:complete len:1098 (+),score=280.47 TRINITY_DN2183_c0_g1_i3:18-3311(+)